MTPLLLGTLGLALAGPVPAVLGRSTWLLRAPRAGVVLWQSLALAAVLAALGSGLSTTVWLASPQPPDNWRWALPVVALGMTLVVATRLAWSVARVALDTRARRRHHRVLVDVLGGRSGDEPALRILAEDTPVAYCLPAVRNARVVLSQGALARLDDEGLAAVMAHEGAHVRARHDLVLEAFTALRDAFPWGTRSELPLRQSALLVEMLADDVARSRVGAAPLARALVVLADRPGPDGTLAAGAEARSVSLRLDRLAQPQRPHRLASLSAYSAAAVVLVVPTVLVAVPWLVHTWGLLH
ncbi:MAG: M56 family metallopeptidase [Nocardioidaceae bacterium]